MGFIITLTGALHITDTITTGHIDTITTIITDVHTEAPTITEVTELQQLLEEVILLVVEELQLQDAPLMFTEEVIVEPIVMTEILVLQEVHEDTIQEEAVTLTTEVLNDQLEREVTTQMVADLLAAIEVHLVQQEIQEDILLETIELPIIMVFVNLHQLETLEAILRETKVLIERLKNHILQENLEAIQNLQEALVVTLLHQEVVLHLEVTQEEVAEVHQEVLEDNL
ncbi:hypothetical protein D6T69_05140 [Tenacibaculum singaporense]|uniref:Uncharacterized protein n=1 Tax=Tenacibaculum singaporense TaxID=2358479 RepID=A0A3S8R597_9FLAO|nr:hypothetical protein D6T69_05140 [Tenacibaculum singaporense]